MKLAFCVAVGERRKEKGGRGWKLLPFTQGIVYGLLLVAAGDPAMVGARVNGDGVSHHAGGNGVG